MARPRQDPAGRPRGRRPGTADTRGAILEAARMLFAARGFERTSVRRIAGAAGVDPALVFHYFGTKENVFLSAVELPFEPELVLPQLLAGDRETLGERIATFLVSLLENAEARSRMVALIRAATSEPAAATLLRGLIERRLRDPIAHALDSEDAELRVSFVGTQLVGLAVTRYVVGVEPLASLPPDRVIASIAPTLQRYLTGPLPVAE